MTACVPKIGDRVYWEPLTRARGEPPTYGSISFVAPTQEHGAYRVSVMWDVADGEGRHETQHHLTSSSHVKFVEKDPAQ